MRDKVLISLCSLLIGAGAMFLLMSGPLAVVKAECPGEPGKACGNGDVNGDGTVDMSDPVYLLMYLFAHGPDIVPVESPCPPVGVCTAEGRFVDNGDGTVTDPCTGLMWQKDSASGRYDWQQAFQFCADMRLGEYTDWRLPNVRELQSIVDYGRDHPAIDPVFESTMSWYWSSSTLVVTPSDAWAVCFGYGGAVLEFEKTETYCVRAVRGGQ